MIDWDLIIDNLKDGKVITVDPDKWDMSNPEYKEMLDLWQSNNFNTSSVRWINYYEQDLGITVANQLGIIPVRSWISCVEPGYMTGYHYDIDDNEKEYLKRGKLKRYSVFMNKPEVGHLFILGTDYHFNKPQGSVVEWKHYKDWHQGINGSFTNKYMFHLIGF
jgi:hypothetical protein